MRLITAVAALAMAAGCGDDDGGGGGDVTDAAPRVDSAAGDPDAAPPPMGEAVNSIQGARIGGFNGYEDDGIVGYALLIRTADDKTRVEVSVSGLEATTEYPAHVHNLPCEFDNGGGHYLIDPAMEAGETNEIWPAFTTDENGDGFASVTADHVARGDALSVVIHDPDNANAKMACGDFTFSDAGDVVATGTFASFDAAEAMDEDIAGTATLIRRATSTSASVTWTGLDDGEAYVAHVHNQPCAVQASGSHYKRDPTIGAAEENNEIWFTVADFADGGAEDSVEVDGHVARFDAQSIALHREGVGKVACADLTRVSYPALWTMGTSMLLDGAFEHELVALSATGSVTRTLNGLTEAQLSVTGMAAGETYPVHVHDRPCSVSNGGAHYKIDPEETETVEANEIWPNVTADDDGNGEGWAMAVHTVRAEAQSLVLHEPDSGDRLICIDLD